MNDQKDGRSKKRVVKIVAQQIGGIKDNSRFVEDVASDSEERVVKIVAQEIGGIKDNSRFVEDVASDSEERVVKIIAQQLGKEIGRIKDNSRFIEDLGCDSLDLVELMMALEEEFRCEIPDDEAAKILTIQDAKDYIKIKLDQS